VDLQIGGYVCPKGMKGSGWLCFEAYGVGEQRRRFEMRLRRAARRETPCGGDLQDVD